MRLMRIFTVLCFGLLFHAVSAFAVPLPKDAFPVGYESWEKRVLSCRLNNRVTVELETYTHRESEGIVQAVSIWYVNGNPFEAKYFEPLADSSSLSGYRATGYTIVLYHDGRWLNLGGEHLMSDVGRVNLRMIRYARLKEYDVSEEDFKKGWASCNRDRPGQLR